MSIVVAVELPGSSDADLGLVDTLARLQLVALGRGYRLRFVNASPDLVALVTLLGLAEVLPCTSASGREPAREAEQREEPLGVEKPVQSDDPAV